MIFRICLILFLATSYQGRAADKQEASDPPAERFIAAPAVEQPRVHVVLTAAHRYCFVPPRGWVVSSVESTRTVYVVDPERRCTVTIQFRDTPAQAADPAWEKEWIEGISKKFTNARLETEIRASVMGQDAAVVDIWPPSDGAMDARVRRYVRVAAAAGHIEFSMDCPAAEFGSFVTAFMHCLTSFRSAPLSERIAIRAFPVE
jgi:hypothetical protein